MAKNWYVVHTYSGFEGKVKSSIEEKIRTKGLEDKIGRILVPTEKVIDHKKNKKREMDRKFYPGYILVEMDLDDETWHIIKSTLRVTGFVGGMKPVPVPEDEVEMIFQQVERGSVSVLKTHFEKGEQVKINDGPFTNFVGVIDHVDADHGRLKVMVSIFGRLTPVELSFSQVEKA